MSFTDLLAGAEARDGGFDLNIPESWHQGRTAFGGLSAALALSAARQQGGANLAPLRSAAISFVGPLAGRVAVRARLLRQGKNASWVSAEILRDGGVGLTASFVYMRQVPSVLHLNECPIPAGIIPPQDLVVLEPGPHAPVVAKAHFDVAFALPPSPAPGPEASRWVRLRREDGLDPATALLLVGDSLPLAVLHLVGRGTPVSSMIWQANFLTDQPQTRDGWWLLRSRANYAADGCSSQIMTVWNADGEPVMTGMQSVAVFG